MKQASVELKAPFPWFGGKRRVADLVWERFGNPLNYVEPFAGSLAVLLGRPSPPRTETVNDTDTYLANFWRAVTEDPEMVAYYADWPVNEADLHARHLWLINQVEFRERMMTDPHYYDAKIAGWWVWGLSSWIGSGWCDVSGSRRKKTPELKSDRGTRVVSRQLPMIGCRPSSGGVHKQKPYLKRNVGIHSQRVTPQNGRSKPNLRPKQAVHALDNGITDYMMALQERLRRTRVVCGDWSRIMGPSATYLIGMTAVFLDPPYHARSGRQDGLYSTDDMYVADDVRNWCLEEIDEHGFTGPRYQHPKLRIALCGYEEEHAPFMPDDWVMVAWKANGGYGNRNGKSRNAKKERIWFSPNCLRPDEGPLQLGMFGGE